MKVGHRLAGFASVSKRSGQASINNVVDATNYVMLELGHPMHAFDMIDPLKSDRGQAPRAVKRFARRMVSTAALITEMCVIADATRAVAIAGVMGGGGNEIVPRPATSLLESACFDPISIRRTSKSLGLRTEASIRFERGADTEMGGAGFASLRRTDSAIGRRRRARGRSRRLSWAYRSTSNRTDPKRVSACHGIGRSRCGHRSNSFHSRLRTSTLRRRARHAGHGRRHGLAAVHRGAATLPAR